MLLLSLFFQNFRVRLLPASPGNLLLLQNVSSSLMWDSVLIRWWMCAHVNKRGQMNGSSAFNHEIIVCIQHDPVLSHTCFSSELQELSWHPGLQQGDTDYFEVSCHEINSVFDDHSGEPGIVQYMTLSLPLGFASPGKRCFLEHRRVSHSCLPRCFPFESG